MGDFEYTDEERKINKVLKYNRDISEALLNDNDMKKARENADESIKKSLELLQKLGRGKEAAKMMAEAEERAMSNKPKARPEMKSWDSLCEEAERAIPGSVELEDILTPSEISSAIRERDAIEAEFSHKTSINNTTDLKFLAISAGLYTAKSLIFPYLAKRFNYGEHIDKTGRLEHNDPSIIKQHRDANDTFRDKHLHKNTPGRWINILYQTPPYDTTVGSAALGINMGGSAHRLYTLGHDPILGWVFGTANILTDVVTLNTFDSYRVSRVPKLHITPERVGLGTLFGESWMAARDEYMNFPAAVFAQAQHLKSDVKTKMGLPIPILSTLNENFASELYRSNYDALCFARDVKIIGTSYVVSKIFDTVIGLAHGLYMEQGENRRLYEVRTRKILLISNAIASGSSIINAAVTKNPKRLDIGGVLNSLTRLFTDIRFMLKLKQEFIEKEIDAKLQAELDEVDRLYNGG